jgi:hypothetical protein
MANTYIKHIVLSICFCAGVATAGFCQQTDSAAKVVDTIVNTAPIAIDSTASQDDYEDTATKSMALKEFALKDTNFTAKQRQIAPEEVKKITSDDAFWYANKPMPKDKEVEESNTTPAWLKIVRVVFWVLVVGCFVAILVMFLTNSKAWVFKPRAKKIIGEEPEVMDDAEGNIFDIDFDKRINKALDVQDYRLATRLLFLRLLRSMAEKNIIKYSIDKTNLDYLFELGSTKYYKDFSAAARNYEYVWYGNFSMQQGQFAQVRQLLEELTRQIKN